MDGPKDGSRVRVISPVKTVEHWKCSQGTESTETIIPIRWFLNEELKKRPKKWKWESKQTYPSTNFSWRGGGVTNKQINSSVHLFLSQVVAIQMLHHPLLSDTSIWRCHFSVTNIITMFLFKVVHSVMCLFNRLIALIMKSFSRFFENIQ